MPMATSAPREPVSQIANPIAGIAAAARLRMRLVAAFAAQNASSTPPMANSEAAPFQ